MTDKEVFDLVRDNYNKANKEYFAEQVKRAMELEKDPEKLKKAINDDITKRLIMGEDYFR